MTPENKANELIRLFEARIEQHCKPTLSGVAAITVAAVATICAGVIIWIVKGCGFWKIPMDDR